MSHDPPDPFIDDKDKLLAERNATITQLTKERDTALARLDKAAKVFREQRDHLAHLEAREKEATKQHASAQLRENDLRDALKDKAILLLIEMQDGVRDVTVFTGEDAASAAQRAHTASNAKVAFLCTVVAGPVENIQRLTNAWTTAITRTP